MDKIKIILPHGALGADCLDDFIDAGLRQIAIAASDDEGEWSEKYGTDFENDVFMMRRYCWCEKEDCKWCSGEEPNFRHKKSGLEISWYKYIGRGMNKNIDLSVIDFTQIINECILSLNSEPNDKRSVATEVK